MKKNYTLWLSALFILFCLYSRAQECAGSSGPGVCTASASLPAPGFYPSQDSLPCVIDGTAYDTVVQFKSPDSASGYKIQSVQIVSISNLPCGLCWSMGETNNTIDVTTNPDGCIRIQGTSYDAPGQYLMKIYANVTVLIGTFPYTVDNLYLDSVAGLKYWLRVSLPGGSCPIVNTAIIGNTATTSGHITTPAISGNATICAGTTDSLSVPGTGYYAYIWSTGAFTSSINVTTAGTYTVTVYGSCTTATATKTITLSTPVTPVITAGGPTTFCQGGSVTLTSTAATTYHWSTGGTAQAVNATASGSYSVTTTNSSGCSASSTATLVTVNALPNDSVTASGATALCAGGSVTLTAKPGLTYSWSNNATTQSINVTQAGSYAVTVSNTNCSAASTPIGVTVNAFPDDTVTAGGPLTFCSDSSLKLTAAPGLSYQWSSGATSQAITLNQANQSGTYSVTVTGTGNCTAVSVPMVVTIKQSPNDTVTVTGATAFCAGGSVILTAAPGLVYSWSNSAATQSINVAQSGTYKVTVSNASCSAVSAPVAVTVTPLPDDTVTASGPGTFCAGNNIMLTAAPGYNYRWSNGATTQSATITQSGTYTVTLTTANNCSAVSAPDSVTVNPVPSNSVNTSGPITFCQGGSVTLTAVSTGNSYFWNTTAVTQAITVSQSGGYTVTVTNSFNCSAVSNPVVVTVNPTPGNSVTASGALTFCAGDSIRLSAASGLTYAWSNGAATQIITVKQSGIYSVTLTGSGNCSAVSNADTVIVNSIPNSGVTSSGPTTFCAGDSVTLTARPGLSYSWSNNAGTQSIVVSQTGSYTVTVSNAGNCSAVSNGVGVTVNPLPSNAVNTSGSTIFCAGDSVTLTAATGAKYLWSDGDSTQSTSVRQSGSYNVTVTNNYNCSAVSAPVAVTVNPATAVTSAPVSQSACIGGNVSFNIDASGTGLSYLWYFNGNSTGVTNDNYNIVSALATDTGSYFVIVSGTCGNDTTAPVKLTLTGSITISQQPASQTVCAGSPITLSVIANGANAAFQWLKDGQIVNGAQTSSYLIPVVSAGDTGSYKCSITSGCGDTVSGVAVLGIKYPSSYAYTHTMCPGSYNFNGHALTAGGTYVDTLNAGNGCDSIVTLTLNILPSLHSNISQTICPGQSYPFNGQLLTTAGAYTDTLTSTGGCDSVVTLNLSVNQAVTINISGNICNGNSYRFNGQSITTAGTYSDTVTGSGGCDSITVLSLAVNQSSAGSITQNICSGSSYIFNGRILNSPGNYSDTLTNAHGCDSVVTLSLTVNAPADSNIYAAICGSGTYYFRGQYLNTAGDYYDTLTNGTGCDSIVHLKLSISPVVVTNLNAAICAGGSYAFNGLLINQPGVYADTLNTAGGCDSVVNLTLTLNSPSVSTLRKTICAGSSYNFHGTPLTMPGTYNDTLQGSQSCDSIVSLILTVQQAYTASGSTTICQGSGYNFNGVTLTAAGTYTDTLQTVNGCDSIITLILHVNQPMVNEVNAGICSGSSYNFNGRVLSATGVYYDSIPRANGCDSIVKLNLQISSTISTSFNASICQGGSYTFDGRLLTAAGAYTDTLQASGGCDSIVTLHLSTHPTAYTQSAASICPGGAYNFNGALLTAAGTYSDTLFTANGCDSIVNLTLTIRQPATSYSGITVCNGSSYNFNGHALTAPGTYTDTLSGSNSCDSIVILTLQFSSALYTNIYDTICNGSVYNFNGAALHASGAYGDTLSALGGCDSIITLNLTVLSLQVSTINQDICTGSSYLFNGHYIIISGTYADTMQSNFGCDSIITLNLNVFPAPAITWATDDTLCTNSAGQITLPAALPGGGTYTGAGVNGNVLTASGPGAFPVTYSYVDSNGCANSETKTFLVETCQGIDLLSLESSISLYPNPANDKITVQSDLFADFTVTPVVYDITGKVLGITYTRDGDEIILNTRHLEPGMYWVRLTVAGLSASRKFIKAE